VSIWVEYYDITVDFNQIHSVHLSAFLSMAKEKLRPNYTSLFKVDNSTPKEAEASKHLNAAYFLSVMSRNELPIEVLSEFQNLLSAQEQFFLSCRNYSLLLFAIKLIRVM